MLGYEWVNMKEQQWEVWVTAGGRNIPVNEMSEDHAKNVLNMLLRKEKVFQGKSEICNDSYYEIMGGDAKWGK